MQPNTYQILLILSGVLVSALFGVFLFREIFPEYMIYQNDYIALENFRSTYSHQSPPIFKKGIKQIVIEREDRGPSVVDRCTSCHVALEIPYFSKTKIAHDLNGNIARDEKGRPLLILNEEYIWKKLEDKIDELRDPQVIDFLKAQGNQSEVKDRLKLANSYEDLKTAKVGNQVYDVTKVLSMHPLIGHETRPFEYHPIEDYSCTSCHNGNGRGLTTDKAHGPIYDGQYEVEHHGLIPQFTETDVKNDPPFSRVFNSKPGNRLLFQTEPLFVGALIQAKCMQCHQRSEVKIEESANQLSRLIENQQKNLQYLSGDDENTEKQAVSDLISLKQEIEKKRSLFSKQTQQTNSSILLSDVDTLTENYQKGKELYLSQACYACHRIAGFARGGVGPDLTKIGNYYPWYIKESIVWPQADLPNSTMPNFRLDHREIENLMTFLLAQKGGNRAVASTTYQRDLQKWEAGQKMPWEKPISPSQMHNLNYAMTLFATEGCASCHRLQGFESNVGFKSEKPLNVNQYEIDRTWFIKLFPEVVHFKNYDEPLLGSQIVQQAEKHQKEIDERIISNIRENSLLEEIDQKYPDVIESMYSNFQYASRAKDADYQFAIANEKDEPKKEQLKKENLEWKERIHRLLMMSIQIYGFGRLIGPHLNWSGIYRTNQWLMEHFRNPMGHVPRSIMPAFPFDDTKFYALTEMLDQLGIQNRNKLRQQWTLKGFDPKEVYEALCVQCHGIERYGNGVIAEWLYPIPKNLRHPDFLRNLSKEKAIYSITHGVKGTPMAPWGEVASDKQATLQYPVLSHSEIKYLVDWLFSSLPGEQIIKQTTDLLKWSYSAEDAEQEFKREGSKLLPSSEEKKAEIFDVVSTKTDTGDKSYYIKKKYYTQENIQKGQDFFLLNCAVCHGNEADGSGVRGTILKDAKPRMLTNLDWIRSRDDLRLLRSIKYGVPGTSMTPWGDLTNSLQRLQLVMFIRSLTENSDRTKQLQELLYQAFDTAQFFLEEMRVAESKKIEQLQQELDVIDLQIKKQKFDEKDEQSIENIAPIYSRKHALQKELMQLNSQDNIYLELKILLKKEREIYFNLGVSLVNLKASDFIWSSFLKMIALNENRYDFNEYLTIRMDDVRDKQMKDTQQIILDAIDQEILQLKEEKNETQVDAYEKIKNKLTLESKEMTSFIQEEKKLVQELREAK